jgi:hypothetical protein
MTGRLLAACAAALGVIAPPAATQTDLGAAGPEHQRLAPMAGTWDVTLSFPAGPGRQAEGRAACEAQWAMDGRFLRLEYSSTFMGRPLTIVRYVGFDRARQRVVEIQLESTHTDVLHASGAWSADGRSFTTEGTHLDAAAGEIVPVRSITTLVEADTFTLELIYGPDTAAPRRITLTHRRRG